MQKARLAVASGEEDSFTAVCPGQVPVWTAVHDWAALSTIPPDGRRGEGRMDGCSAGRVCVSPGICPPSSLAFQDLGRTPLIGQDVPKTSHPQGHHSLTQSAAELTLPRPCLCGSAPAPSTDQSVPAKSKRRPSQGGNNQAGPPQMHPADRTYLVLVIYNGESKHRHHS